MKRILTGITPSGYPHLGNYIGAIKPSLELLDEKCESFLFIADLHALIKVSDPEQLNQLTHGIALAWMASGLDPEKTYFYRQSDVPEITELAWILSCVTEKGLLNRAHAYKAATDVNKESGKKDTDEGISMGLFSYPLLMACDILTPNATHVPVGKDQKQHLEIARDIAEKFNKKYGEVFNIPEAVINEEKTVLGTDGRKMSKSYNNIVPILSSEKDLKKSIMSIVTNSQEPGEKKDWKDNTLFSIYSSFAADNQIKDMKHKYEDGIGWGDAKNIVFNDLNDLIKPIRDKYLELESRKSDTEEILQTNAKEVRTHTQSLIKKVKEFVGIKKL
ncbi:MAG: tryptophan--tRNA ligase [Gammaproteobacteria bacterium]|jgi:tryptophanyl-tRNA synthetase|nr:MAG: tryptophan--tRNA ligase [Gammaproteobacteria bacterium]|tara:strand:+ start:202 stop:1197 length:996 start_codon:yes stop_codon:yes gene_type:complete